MEQLELPVMLEAIKDSEVLAPEEYTYWEARQNRVFYIDFEIDDDYCLIELSKVIIQLNTAEMNIPKEELKPIYLYIHSYGGDIDQAQYFCDLCIASRIPIITVGMGACMSAGFLILLAGHKRYAFKHCNMLIHSGSAGFSGTAEQIDEAQKAYKKQIEGMKTYILGRTSIDEKLFNKNKSKDWYLTYEDIEKYGVANLIESFDDIVK